MLLRNSFWVSLLAAISVLMAGCRSPRPQSAQTSPDAALSIATPPVVPIRNGRNADTDIVEAHAHYSAGIVYELNGEPALALKEYYLAALEDPTNEILVLDTSRQFLQAKQPEKALEILQRATAQPNAPGVLFARLAFIYSRLNQPDEAIKASRVAIKKEPHLLAGYQNLFLNYLLNKQYADAMGLLDEAAKVPNTDGEFLIGLAELYANFGLQVPTRKPAAFAKSEAVLQRADKLKISDPPLRLRLADAYNVIGKDEPAARIYGELLKEFAEVPLMRDNLRAKLAEIYLHNSDSSRAAEQLEAIIRDNPTDAQAYYFLGNIAFEAKHYTQAGDYYTKTLLLNPDFEPAYYDLASAQVSADKDAEALATLDKARQKFSASFALEYLTAVAYGHLKDFTNAINHFTAAEVVAKAGDSKRLNDIFYFEFGVACERNGKYAEAERNFQKCLALSPDFVEAQNYLGYMWADHGEKLEQARALIEKALKAEPKSAAYLDSMGWVLFKLNQPRPALNYILQAVKLSKEEDATLYDHLGEIYSALGEKDKAAEAWRKSLAAEDNEQVRKKLAGATGNPGGY